MEVGGGNFGPPPRTQRALMRQLHWSIARFIVMLFARWQYQPGLQRSRGVQPSFMVYRLKQELLDWSCRLIIRITQLPGFSLVVLLRRDCVTGAIIFVPPKFCLVFFLGGFIKHNQKNTMSRANQQRYYRVSQKVDPLRLSTIFSLGLSLFA